MADWSRSIEFENARKWEANWELIKIDTNKKWIKWLHDGMYYYTTPEATLWKQHKPSGRNMNPEIENVVSMSIPTWVFDKTIETFPDEYKAYLADLESNASIYAEEDGSPAEPALEDNGRKLKKSRKARSKKRGSKKSRKALSKKSRKARSKKRGSKKSRKARSKKRGSKKSRKARSKKRGSKKSRRKKSAK
jgi:hypothetical protein